MKFHVEPNLLKQNNNLDKYQKIWRVVQLIPEGKVLSYGLVADLAGLPGRARLVGKCLGYVPSEGYMGQNVPWHRVLRASGEIAFPNGSEAFENQRALLMEEGVQVKGRRVNLKQYLWTPDLLSILFQLDS